MVFEFISCSFLPDQWLCECSDRFGSVIAEWTPTASSAGWELAKGHQCFDPDTWGLSSVLLQTVYKWWLFINVCHTNVHACNVLYEITLSWKSCKNTQSLYNYTCNLFSFKCKGISIKTHCWLFSLSIFLSRRGKTCLCKRHIVWLLVLIFCSFKIVVSVLT